MIDQTNYTRGTEVEVDGKDGTWVVGVTYFILKFNGVL